VYRLTVRADVSSGKAELRANLIDRATGQATPPVSLTTVEIAERVRSTAVPTVNNPMQADLGGLASFLGYDVEARTFRSGENVRLTLYWEAQQAVDTGYTVFVHLLDGQERIWGQVDSVPGRGTLPTTGWVAGEVIVDEYDVPIKGDAPAGEYVVELGMYDAATGQRLPVLGGDGREVGNRILLPRIAVGAP